MIDPRVDDSRSRDESAPRPKIFADAGHDIAQTESLAVTRKDSFPKRSVAHDSARLVEASRPLERGAVHFSEHNAAVDVRDAIVVAAEYTVGVRDAKARLAADVALRAEDVVDRSVATGWRQAAV